MHLTTFKELSAALTLTIGLGGVLTPLALRSNEAALSMARTISVGVMLGGGLLHLLPESAEELSAAYDFPVAYLLFALGLLLPLAVETLMLAPPRPAVRGSTKQEARWESLELAGDPPRRHDASDETAPLCCPAGGFRRSSGDDELDHHDHQGGDEHHVGALVQREMPLSTALVLLTALSFHSVLEGLAQGTARSLETGSVLLLAIAAHKGLAAVALGCTFLDARLPTRRIVLLGLGFALATPLGTLAGLALPGEGAVGARLSASLEATAGGSFTYVALLELLPRELRAPRTAHSVPVPGKLAGLFGGFGAMALLALVV